MFVSIVVYWYIGVLVYWYIGILNQHPYYYIIREREREKERPKARDNERKCFVVA
jgi:hypothetical protein